MDLRNLWVKLVAGAMALCGAPAVHAQFAVIDAGAIAQLIQQVQTLRAQLETARGQLTQAQSTYESMTGGRGMEQLLSGIARNYLPPDWAALEAVLRQGGGGYGGLAAQMRQLIEAGAVLSPAQLAALSVAEREQLEEARRLTAMMQLVTREALSNSSARFAALQQLVGAIPGATDQKAILDLQARVAAEQAMLQNEQTKLDVLYQVARAEELARRRRAKEQAMADIGVFEELPPMGL